MLRAKTYPNLELSTHAFPDESHNTVAITIFIRGLVAVYGRPGTRSRFPEVPFTAR